MWNYNDNDENTKRKCMISSSPLLRVEMNGAEVNLDCPVKERVVFKRWTFISRFFWLLLASGLNTSFNCKKTLLMCCTLVVVLQIAILLKVSSISLIFVYLFNLRIASLCFVFFVVYPFGSRFLNIYIL